MDSHRAFAGQAVSRRMFLKGVLAAGAAGALTGCTTVAPMTGSNDAQPAQGSAAQPAGEITTVTFLIWGGEIETQAWENRRQGFIERYPDLDVEVTIPPGNYTEKLTAMIASGTAPDTFVSLDLRCDAERGLILALDDFVASDPDFDAEDWFPGLLETTQVGGVQYALPGGLGPQVLFWNVDFFEEAGLENPNDLYERGEWTYDKMLEYAHQLNQEEDGQITRYAYLPYTQWWTYIHGFGGNPFNEDYSESYMDQEENYAPLQWYADLWLQEQVAPKAEARQEFGSWPGFRDGKYAMFISGPWQMARLADSPYNWDIAWPPLQEGGRAIMNAGGSGAVVYAQTQHPEAAWKWISFVESAEGQAIWAQLGTDLPSHPSLVADFEAGKYLTNPDAAPPSMDLWYKVVDVAVPSPHTYLGAQATDLFNQAFSRVDAGEATAEEAFTEINEDINVALTTC